MGTEPRSGPDGEELRGRLQAALGERYAVEKEVGAGATGTVFAAQDLKHDRMVAIKVLRPELAASVGAERFLREIRIAARLTHPHIVPLHDSGEQGGLLYYVMPLEEGESLRALLDREGTLPVARAVAIARDVAQALGHAHASGIVHRDVKPGNILLVGEHALLADFGVAQAVEAASDRVTTSELAVGTPAYMSPEQVAGDATLDGTSDIYSLGCVLYEMLAGRRPFHGRSPVAALADRMLGRVPDVREGRPDVPPELASAIDRALAAEPGERFPDAAGFVEALSSGSAARVPWWVPAGALTAVLALTALFVAPRMGDSADLTDQEGSVVVLPFADAIQTPEEGTLVVDLADELTRQLNRWDAVRAVPQVSLQGVTFDLGIGGPILTRIEDGFNTARTLGVESLVTLNVRIRGDSAEVTATRFDPRRKRSVGRPLEARGSVRDPFRLAAQIAHGILGLEGPVDEVENLRRQSSNPTALLRYEEGLQLMARWRLAEAEAALRQAVALDSAFAMAHHYLALDLYWQAAREPLGLARLGPEAARLSHVALRHSEGLPPRERDGVVAFSRFLEGDYQAARAGYRELLARDSTDVDAWLLQGIVEFQDPWLVQEPDGSLRPRSDMNTAVRSFRETIRLSPGFHLGYGHLFDITEDVLRTATVGQVRGFERPRDEIVPPWEPATHPGSELPFALVNLDSLTWVPYEAFLAMPRSRRLAGATALLASSMRALGRWVAYAPDEPRPHMELATWTVRQRALLEGPQRPELLDSLARVARGNVERALALSPDTLAADLVRLGNLYLATGEGTHARELVQTALDLGRDDQALLPRSVSNAFLYSGQWRTALDHLDREPPAERRFWPDTLRGAMLDEGGAENAVRRLQILGATGAGEDALESVFSDLEALWATPREGAAPVRFLRGVEASRVAPALAEVPDILSRWRAEADLTDPVWAAVDPSTDDRISAIRAALTVEAPDVPEPGRSYLLGWAALQAGDPPLAIRLLARLDSLPLSLENRDVGWGLQALSLFRRAEAYAAAGDRGKADAFLGRFLATRAREDDSAPFEAAARGLLKRLAEGG